MTEHLPECADQTVMPHAIDCFCAVIRACEQRVITAAVHRVEAIPAPNRMIDVMPRGEQFVRRSAAIAAIKGEQT